MSGTVSKHEQGNAPACPVMRKIFESYVPVRDLPGEKNHDHSAEKSGVDGEFPTQSQNLFADFSNQLFIVEVIQNITNQSC